MRGDAAFWRIDQRAEFVAVRKNIFAKGTDDWMLLKRGDRMLHFRMTVLHNGWRLGMFRDVTDLEGARQSAVEARQTLLLAMEAIDDGIAFLDRDERLVQCNEAYRRFMQGLPEIVTPGVLLHDAVHFAGKVLKPPKEPPEVWAERQLATFGFAEDSGGQATAKRVQRLIDLMFFRWLAGRKGLTSSSGTSAAILTGCLEASKLRIGPTPLWPLRQAFQKASLPIPLGATTPSPVTTTLRIDGFS